MVRQAQLWAGPADGATFWVPDAPVTPRTTCYRLPGGDWAHYDRMRDLLYGWAGSCPDNGCSSGPDADRSADRSSSPHR